MLGGATDHPDRARGVEGGAGDYPAELDALVGVFLAPDGITFGWLYGTDGATYSLFGPC